MQGPSPAGLLCFSLWACARSIIAPAANGQYDARNTSRENDGRCQKKSFQAIGVYRPDRISRNIGDFARLIEELGEIEIDFVSVKEQWENDRGEIFKRKWQQIILQG